MKTLKAQSLKTQKSVSPEQNSKPSPQGETLLDKLKASSTFQQAKNGSESQSKEAEPQSQNTEGIKREIEQSENKDTKQKENDEGKQNLLEAVKKEGGEASESLGGKLEESEDKEKTNGSNEGLMSHMEPALEGLDAKKEEEIPSHQKMDIEMSIEGKKEEPKPIVTESLTDANGCQTPAGRFLMLGFLDPQHMSKLLDKTLFCYLSFQIPWLVLVCFWSQSMKTQSICMRSDDMMQTMLTSCSSRKVFGLPNISKRSIVP